MNPAGDVLVAIDQIAKLYTADVVDRGLTDDDVPWRLAGHPPWGA